ncbi:hypothetical protein FRX31_035403 [Thalictrum thalictroides]|uniref:DUF4283 domain-containing protein n=1 Tax=Thalictrum thalictroides TaxID=46969 RepID=A0A7J6URW0_THATH|nr:hypothetical protein FRX31_035403 [Thalictrum thalictroides]
MVIPLQQLHENSAYWVNAMIITLWNDEHLNPNIVIRQIQLRWGVGVRMNMIRVGSNKLVRKIHQSDDLERVENGHPWQVMGCIVLIKPYSSPTNSESISFNRVPLWFFFKGPRLAHPSHSLYSNRSKNR